MNAVISRKNYNEAIARLSVGVRVEIIKEVYGSVTIGVVPNWYATVYDVEPDYDGTILVRRESDDMIVSAHPLDMFVVDAGGRLIESEG